MDSLTLGCMPLKHTKQTLVNILRVTVTHVFGFDSHKK